MDEVTMTATVATEQRTVPFDDVVFIEVLDKHEAMVERHRFERLPIVLGAAYSSDYIVDAEGATNTSAVSLTLERDEQGDLVLTSTTGANEFWAPGGMTKRWKVDPDQSVLVGGQRLRIRTKTYVPSGKTHGAAATPRALAYAWLWAVPLAMLSFAGITWMSDIDGTKAITYLTSGLGILMLIIIWAAIWSLVSRLTGRSTHFLTHLALGAMAFIAVTALDYLFDTAAFSFNLPVIQRYDYALVGIIFGVAAWCHGHLIARIRNVTAVITAVLIGGGLFATSAAGFYTLRGNLASTQTLTEMRPPALRVASGSSIDKFFSDASSLKEEAEKSKPEKPDGFDFTSFDTD
jgi:hypothetical protein